jgi:NADPH-dependent glutamate synthase beta subunit-like oxidoreductase/NAD(P)H-flavin reductase
MKLNLNGFEFQELFTPDGLKKLDSTFLGWLNNIDPEAHKQLQDYRYHSWGDGLALSDFYIRCAEYLDTYITELFNLQESVAVLRSDIIAQQPIFVFKQVFVIKKARRLLSKLNTFPSYLELHERLMREMNRQFEAFNELNLATFTVGLLGEEALNEDMMTVLSQWAAYQISGTLNEKDQLHWVSFKLPKKCDHDNLVPLETVDRHVKQLPEAKHVIRDGFKLTDKRMTRLQVLSEIDYCVYCHEKNGDFCSKGFPVKKGKPELGFKHNHQDLLLTGCPLEEKISEMHVLKKTGYSIGALATIMIDNPMCPVTGHRICNDCMKACIYQKQDPVNIPEIETRTLTDVINLPWGVEIYDLLTRWNPLRRKQFLMQPYNGAKVMVMGMGPAGFTLAHHLLLEGFAVVGADGLKLEPLNEELLKQPIENFSDIREALDDRVMAGFGGVAEYGITVRWDKNFLKLILISLLRKPCFQLVGSIRFGGSLTLDDAWRLGFDHLSVAVGAGLPKELAIENSLAVGMRQANDFLMALQLTGAQKQSALSNLQIRMPVAIIGGGLTGVDAATEAQAYYFVQIEKMSKRYYSLVERFNLDVVRAKFSHSDLAILDEYLLHATQLKEERELAAAESRQPDLIGLARRWGGVTIVYRRTVQESPAYRLNHEELEKAMEQGLYYSEHHTPRAVILDKYSHVKALRCVVKDDDEELERVLAVRTILVATGAKPNVAYEFEHRGTFAKQGFEYKRFDLIEGELALNDETDHVKSSQVGPFTSYSKNGKLVSFLGDTHSVFHGSVVKAVASAKRIYPEVVTALSSVVRSGELSEYAEFHQRVHDTFRSKVLSVSRVSDDYLQLQVYSPLAAQQFYPGQFYRIQTYESQVDTVADTLLHMEALALIGVQRPSEPDTLTFLVKSHGVSSRLVERFQPGDRLSVMGPTGAKLPLPERGSLMIVGGDYARIQILSIGYQLKKMAVPLVFFSLHGSQLCDEEVKLLCSEVITVQDDKDLVTSLESWAAASVSEVSQLHLFVAADLLKKVQAARSDQRLPAFTHTKFSAAVFGPMQCMLKGVCAQCLQWQIDPQTGKRTKAVYACSWQNQPLEIIDLDNLNERLAQNSCQETLSSMWLEHILDVNENEV